MTLSEIAIPCLTLIVGAGGTGGLWAFLASRAKSRADAPAAMVNATAAAQAALNSLQTALSAEAQRLMGDLRSEIDVMRKRVEVLEAENQQCRGENAQMQQDIASLKLELNKAGIPIPIRPPPGSFTVIERDRTTTYEPQPSMKDEVPHE